MNASFGFRVGNNAAPSTALSKSSLGLDYLAIQTGYLLVKSAGNQAYTEGNPNVTPPGDSFNGLSVGASVNPDGMAGVNSSFQGPAPQRWPSPPAAP